MNVPEKRDKMRAYVMCETEVPDSCSKSQPGVRCQFKGPSGAFVTYCNSSCFFFDMAFTVLSRLFHLCRVNHSVEIAEKWSSQGKNHLTCCIQNLAFSHELCQGLSTLQQDAQRL